MRIGELGTELTDLINHEVMLVAGVFATQVYLCRFAQGMSLGHTARSLGRSRISCWLASLRADCAVVRVVRSVLKQTEERKQDEER